MCVCVEIIATLLGNDQRPSLAVLISCKQSGVKTDRDHTIRLKSRGMCCATDTAVQSVGKGGQKD